MSFEAELKKLEEVKSGIDVVMLALKNVPSTSAPTPAETYRAQVVKLEQFNKAKGNFLEFLKKAVLLFQEAFGSQEFYDAMIKEDWKEDRGYTQAQIYDYIAKGGTMYEKPDGEINLHIRLYWANSGVYGYVQNDDHYIYINAYYYSGDYQALYPNALSVASLANTLSHEYSHQAGWSHYTVMNDSVPYKFGNLIEKYARKILAGEKLTQRAIQKFAEDRDLFFKTTIHDSIAAEAIA